MLTSTSTVWGRRILLFAALALFLLHAALLLAVKDGPARSLHSNLLQVACGLLAFLAASQAFYHSTGFARRFWSLQAAALFILVAAQSLTTVYESVLHRPLDEPWPSDILFFLWVAPAFLALFLNPQENNDVKNWLQWLDLAQFVILFTAVYFFTFEIPSHWRSLGISIPQLDLIVESVCDTLLVAAFAIRSCSVPRKFYRPLFGRMAVFFAFYALANGSYVYAQWVRQIYSGSLWDLPWSFAFIVGAILIATAPIVSDEDALSDGARAGQERQSPNILLLIVPLFFPVAVLLMASIIAEQRLVIAILSVVASFACSSARIVLTDLQRQRSAAAFQERTALLKSIFDGSGEAIFVKDSAGRYLIVNQAEAQFYGRSIDDVVGKTSEQLADPATARELTKDDQRVLQSGESGSSEFSFTANGVPRTLLIARVPYRDPSGKIIGLIGSSRDITEYRLMEERLRQSQKMEAIGTLAGGVAHDFNNILMVINGYSSVLAEALSDPKLRVHIQQIQKAGERAASLTRQLLAFSRKQAIQPVPLNLNHVVTSIEKLLHRLIGENITISARLQPDLGNVLADAGQIEQVILNLAVNARDAMPNGGQLTMETRNIFIKDTAGLPKSVKPGHHIEMAINDTGMGMDVNVQRRIFEPFFTTKPVGKGTGLGLSTVYGIVQQANGHVTFTSQPGVGTTFRISLPRIDSAKPSSTQVDTLGASLDGHETILLVEDDPAVCDLVRAILTSHGYSVLSAKRPAEAERIYNEHASRIDLLLSDVVMPEMSGGQLAGRLQNKNPKLKVIFMSGYIDEALMHQEIREKKVAFFQKPFSPHNLAKKVRQVLDGVNVA